MAAYSLHRFTHRPRRAFAGGLLLTVLAVGFCAAEDVVIVASGERGEGRVRRTGEILDYTGQTLLLRSESGVESSIPADRVLEVQSTWTPPHQRGDEQFIDAKFAEALEQYRAAVSQEKRGWVRRRLYAQAVWCYRHLNQPDLAAAVFLTLVTEDPTTPNYDAIPLTWTSAQPSGAFEKRLRTWLTSDQAPANLIAASWLLTTPQRTAAMEKLRSLTTHADHRVALLAEAQLWRAEQSTAELEDMTRWRQVIAKLPEPLRAGPYLVQGQTLSRLGDSRAAVLALLRVPVLYSTHRSLAAEALLAAGREAERLGRNEDAGQLYRELITQYPESDLADLARQKTTQSTP